MSHISVPRRRQPHRELAVPVAACALWLFAWVAVTTATAVAGGRPSVSPVDFINPSRLVQQYQMDGGSLVWWHLVAPTGRVNTARFWAVLVVTLSGIVGALALAVMCCRVCAPASRRWLPLSPRGLRRGSRWATTFDLRRLRVRRPGHGSLILGRRGTRTMATERETSVLVVGPTRSGKTTSLVIPNLFSWRGPAIVTSTKSELVDITAAHRQGLGPVYVYDPTGEISHLYPSVSWSPMDGCQTLDRAWLVASWLCAGLQQGGSRSDNDWSHWAESGKLLIAPLLFCAAAAANLSIVDVRGWIHGFDLETPLSVLNEMAVAGGDDPNSDPARAMGMLAAIDQRPEKERGTVFSTVTRIFSVFNERAVAESAMTSRFNARELCERNGTLYLCTPRQTPERVAALFVGILMTAVTHAYAVAGNMPRGRLDPELGLFLDELANVVPIEDLPSVASQGAGRGVILMSIVQDMSQLRLRYGNEKANSVLNNHGAKLFLPGISDPETCDIVAKMIGRGDYTDVALNDHNGRTNRSFTVRRDQMASPEALRQLDEGTAVLLYRGRPPTIVGLRPWFRDRRLRALASGHFFSSAEQVSRTGPMHGR
ncbi:MAG: type IV secretory system conjugative DNA transfer family protein [Candidatus Dormibacteria bacterium]